MTDQEAVRILQALTFNIETMRLIDADAWTDKLKHI